MAAETNLIKKADLARVREVDFTERFAASVNDLTKLLGITRRMAKREGSVIKATKASGTLQSGTVAEGDVIPLSKYATTQVTLGEITLKKWRKAATAEAILKSGYNEAVVETDNKLLSDVQNSIKNNFFTYLGTIVHAASGTEGQSGYVPAVGTMVTGATLQEVLAKTWGQLQVLFEDDSAEIVHFVHPLTVASYLASANITTQTAFGMTYIEDFLGMGTVILNSRIAANTVISTAKENLIMYYVPVTSEAMSAFDMSADATGYIGITSGYKTEERAQIESMVMSGIQFLVEYADGVVSGTVTGA